MENEARCPRCGQVGEIVARSRVTGARSGLVDDICNPCGWDEALEQLFDGRARPVESWPGSRTFMLRDGEVVRAATGEVVAVGRYT